VDDQEKILAPLRKFRRTAVGLALLITLLVAGVTFPFHRIAAHGVLLGGFTGVLGFWIIAVRLQKLALKPQQNVKFAALTMTGWRFALYGVVLYRAYRLDPEEYTALLGAMGGIMVIRFVLIYLGLTGIDLKSKKSGTTAELDR
jgi:hypothetical protein